MEAFRLIEKMNEQKQALGMTHAVIADRSGVSEPTVVRILSGKACSAHFGHVLAVAEVLGVNLNAKSVNPETILEAQAKRKADKIVRMVRGNSALEATETSKDTYNVMLKKTVRELLTGSKRALWA